MVTVSLKPTSSENLQALEGILINILRGRPEEKNILLAKLAALNYSQQSVSSVYNSLLIRRIIEEK